MPHALHLPLTPGIYMILSKENGHRYIGSAVNIRRRWHRHLDMLRHNKHYSRYLQYAFNKYGESAFICNSLENVPDKTQLAEREQYYIDTLHPEYNIRPIANSSVGVIPSQEKRRKIAASLMGHPVSEEARKKMSISNRREPIPNGHTPEAHARNKATKISQADITRQQVKDIWKQRTPEQKQAIGQRISATKRAKKFQLHGIVQPPLM